jgi:hypothetical protein
VESQADGRGQVFAALFFLGALLVGTALLLPAWTWLRVLAQGGFFNPTLILLGLSLYALAWLVPVTLILDQAVG